MDKRRSFSLTGPVIYTLSLALIHGYSSPADAQPRGADPIVVQSVAEPAVVFPGPSSVFDNVGFFFGLDGSKQPQDLGINANMGVRLAANAGVPVARALPGATVRLEPVGQLNGLARHQWATGAVTTVWAGAATRHDNVVLVFPDNSTSRNVIVYGARLDLPLNERMSITGSGNFLTPTSTGTVDAYLGVTFTPRHRTGSTRSAFSPPLDVANNPEFPVDLRR
ncbi:MAG: hypothetical protein ABMA15_10255 [Vicinamibacterales bacterium]